MKVITRFTIVFFLLVWGNSCKKEPLEPCYSIFPDPNCVCNFLYDPVCGCDGTTYANACAAECSGITIYKKGKCRN